MHREVFVLTTSESSVPRLRRTEARLPRGGYPVGDVTYRFVQVRPERFFGTQKVWIGDTRVSTTDVERTLLDGLTMPQHCGDFAEVIHAFQVGMDGLDIERIARYASRLDAATVKRLGWVLEYHGAGSSSIDQLASLPVEGLPNARPHRTTKRAVQQPLDGPGEPSGDGWCMRPLRTRLQEARRRLGIPREVLERDYLLSWILVGVSQMPALGDALVFKGGTALKKCYFGDYRFSEDLDFSGLDDVPTDDEMERLVSEACDVAVRLLDEYAPVEIVCERYTEREPHPGGQEAFTIRARLPWQSHPQTRVMIEVTVDEPVLRPVQRRRVIHEYGEPLEAEV